MAERSVVVGKQRPEEQEVQVGLEAQVPQAAKVVEVQETVLQTTVCILEAQDQPAQVVQLVSLPQQTTVVVVVVDLVPIPITLEIKLMAPRVEQVAVVVVRTTGFVKADPP
jgi:hypothetical protein